MYDLPLSGLSLPTSALMSQGGDDRITIDERSGLNSYGCAPSPMTSIMYSSSTASSISADAFRHVQAVHFRLRRELEEGSAQDVYAATLEEARNRIRKAFELDHDTDIAFGPSGTDLEYLSLAVAMRTGQTVCNLVVEVEEVGSGCQFSQAGRYFAPRTALGKDVEKGAPLPGFGDERVKVRTLKMRSDMGPVQAAEDYRATLDDVIGESLAQGERPLLHVIHRSKTGIIAPTLAGLDSLLETYGDKVDVIVDACQGRISPAAIHAYLDRGAMVFMTGSKFYGGPPFSAWAFVPKPLASRMLSSEPAPAGLGNFFARAEMPAHWQSCQSNLPPYANFGMLLRLEAALFEIERFFALPPALIDDVISVFNASIREMCDNLPFRLVDARTAGDLEGHEPNPLDRKMLHVVELTLPHPVTGKLLSFEEARTIYHLLYRDISDRFDDPEDILTANEICHLGQPVRCLRTDDGEWAPTLRFALSAPLIAALLGLDAQHLAERFRADLERVGRKIRLAATLLAGDGEKIVANEDSVARC